MTGYNNGYAVGTNNRLTSDGTHTYTYDAEGNRLTRTHSTTGAVNDDNAREEVIDALLDETAQLLTRMKHCDEIHICSSALTDQGIRSLCTNWSGCRRADLSNSSRLTDAGLHQVVENWTNLEELDLSGTAVSDQGILELARLPRLSVLSLGGMDRISIDGTAKLVQHCGALKYLAVSADWLHEGSFQPFRQLVCTF